MKSLKGKNKEELFKIMKEKREALRNFRFGVAGSKVRNVKEGKLLRKDVARILTELSRADKSKK